MYSSERLLLTGRFGFTSLLEHVGHAGHEGGVQLEVTTWGCVSTGIDQRCLLVEFSSLNICWLLNRQYTYHIIEIDLQQTTTLLHAE